MTKLLAPILAVCALKQTTNKPVTRHHLRPTLVYIFAISLDRVCFSTSPYVLTESPQVKDLSCVAERLCEPIIK